MTAISGVLPNLINGVSEQPPPVRLSSQMKSQVNCFPTVVGGLRKRNPTLQQGVLASFPTSAAYYHTINRDSVERYKVAIEDDLIRVATLTGTAKTVNFETVSFTSLDDSVTVEDGTAKRLWVPSGTTTFDVVTTGITTATVIIEESTTGAYGGEETTVATITTNTTTAVSLTSGRWYRAAVSAWTAGTIDVVFQWKDAAYLQCTTGPATDLEVLTVADYTFITNKTVTCSAATTTTGTRNPEALVTINAANFGKTYRIYINGTEVAEMRTPGPSWADNNDLRNATLETQTYNIAEALRSGTGAMDHYYTAGFAHGIDVVKNLEAELGTVNWTFTRYNNVIHIQRNDSTDFTISVEVDGTNSGHYMTVQKDVVNDFTDLPTYGPEGFHIAVKGDRDIRQDDYYVVFEKTATADGSGVWRETVDQGVLTSLDPETMPHQLVRESDGTFTYKRATWGTREVGDLTSVPWPTFVGGTITGSFFFSNRLGFYVDESVVMSRDGEFFNFFPSTTITQLDTDPIDVAISHTDVSVINQIVVFTRQLLLMTNRQIFALDGDELLTARTVNIKPLVAYETDPDVTPVVAGELLFAAVNGNSASQVEEFTYDEEVGVTPPTTVTDHCPGFVPANITKMVANPNVNMVAAISSDQVDRIYVYKYYVANNEKLQSSWDYWTFGSTAILDIDFISEDLYITFNRGGTVYSEKIDCSEQWRDEYPDTVVHLDRRITEAETTPSYDGVADETTFTLPYAASGVSIATRDSPMGVVVTVKSTNGNDVVVDGDLSSDLLFFGFTYESRVVISDIIPKRRAGNSETAIPAGKLVIHHMTFTVATTAYVTVEVTQLYRSDYTHVYTGPAIGSVENPIGVPAYSWTSFRIPIMAPSKEIDIALVSSSSQPFAILNAEWEGVLYRRRSFG